MAVKGFSIRSARPRRWDRSTIGKFEDAGSRIVLGIIALDPSDIGFGDVVRVDPGAAIICHGPGSFSFSRTGNTRPSDPQRISVEPLASHTRVSTGRPIIDPAPEAPGPALPRRPRHQPETARPCPDRSRSSLRPAPTSSPVPPSPEQSSLLQPPIASPPDALRAPDSDARHHDALPVQSPPQEEDSPPRSGFVVLPTNDVDIPNQTTLSPTTCALARLLLNELASHVRTLPTRWYTPDADAIQADQALPWEILKSPTAVPSSAPRPIHRVPACKGNGRPYIL